LTRSSNITQADLAKIHVFFTCRTKVGSLAYLPATYTGTTDSGLDVWTVTLQTTYRLAVDNYLSVEMFNDDDVASVVEVGLDHDYEIITSFDADYDTSIPVDQTLNSYLPDSRQASQVTMAHQTLSIQLGVNLSSTIYTGVTTSWGNDVYKVADHTIYRKTTKPIFQTDENGLLVARYNSTTHGFDTKTLWAAGTTPSSPLDITTTVTTDTDVVAGATTTILPVQDTTGVLVGMAVRGTNIPANTTVKAVSATTVTLSASISKLISAKTVLTFTNVTKLIRTTATQTQTGVQLTVGSTAGLLKGLRVVGLDIPDGAHITDIPSATTITLSVATANPVTTNTLLTILNDTAPGTILVEKGDIVTDAAGLPVIVKRAQNQYRIPAILFDGRLFASSSTIDQSTLSSISDTITTYANQIANIDAGLTENSDIYYKPARTMGQALFGVGDGKTKSLSLELGFVVDVYVEEAVYNSSTLQDTMTSSVMTVLTTVIQQPIISAADIADTLKTVLGSNATTVHVVVKSDDEVLDVIALQTNDVSPSIESVLKVSNDGSIIRVPNVTLTYIKKPDTSTSSLSAAT
jgi:hypothetical protein